jgi:hypothetical protein
VSENDKPDVTDRRDPSNAQLVEYRLGKVEEALAATRKDIHDLRDSLMPAALARVRMESLEETVRGLERQADERYTELSAACAKNDGEFQKWFNRVVGASGLALALAGLFGKITSDRVAELSATMSQIPQVVERLTRQELISRKIVRRLGVDPDMLPEEPK